MSKMQRDKGHSFERNCAMDFQELGWLDARRQLEYHVKDALGVDLQDTEPFAVQCKRGRGYAPITAIEEISPHLHHELQGTTEITSYVPYQKRPLLLTQADRKPTMAVLPWAELKKLIKQAHKD